MRPRSASALRDLAEPDQDPSPDRLAQTQIHLHQDEEDGGHGDRGGAVGIVRAGRRDYALSRRERAGPQGLEPAELSHRASAEAEAAASTQAADAARALLPSERRLLRAHAGVARA